MLGNVGGQLGFFTVLDWFVKVSRFSGAIIPVLFVCFHPNRRKCVGLKRNRALRN